MVMVFYALVYLLWLIGYDFTLLLPQNAIIDVDA